MPNNQQLFHGPTDITKLLKQIKFYFPERTEESIIRSALIHMEDLVGRGYWKGYTRTQLYLNRKNPALDRENVIHFPIGKKQ